MADFSDAEDRLLFRLAKAQLEARRKINWSRIYTEMASTRKSQQQLRRWLKDLSSFPSRFFKDCTSVPSRSPTLSHRPPPASPPSNTDIHLQVSELFAVISPRQLWSTDSTPDAHPCEVTPTGVTAILSELPPLSLSDVFLDVGSGIGNIVAHVALATEVGMTIGIEFQDHLAQLSKTVIYTAAASLPKLVKVFIHGDDVRRTRSSAAHEAMYSSTVAFSNNLVFDPTSIDALEEFATSAPKLVPLVTTRKVCCRHRNGCKRAFCSVWQLCRTIPITASWSTKPHNAFWYPR